MTWLGSWAYRRRIIVDAGCIGSDLTHFPITLYLNGSAGKTAVDLTDIFDEVGSSYLKIAVTKDDAQRTYRRYYGTIRVRMRNAP